MKTIFIRGIPGTGKTIVSEILEKIFPNSEIICVDDFKLKAMKDGKSFEESQKIAYEQTLKELHLFHKQNKNDVILEEIICEKDFLDKLNWFLYETQTKAYWFRLMRKVKELLKVESNRNRQIKNTQEDLFKLKQEIESLKIENEYLIKNDNLALTIKKILEIVI